MLKDPIKYLYFQNLRKLTDELVQQLHLFFKSFKSCVLNRDGDAWPIEQVDFGGKSIFEAMKMTEDSNNDPNMILRGNDAKGRCHSMLLEAA